MSTRRTYDNVCKNVSEEMHYPVLASQTINVHLRYRTAIHIVVEWLRALTLGGREVGDRTFRSAEKFSGKIQNKSRTVHSAQVGNRRKLDTGTECQTMTQRRAKNIFFSQEQDSNPA